MSAVAGAPEPLITAVIPTFRRPRLLRRAVASVLAQENVPLRVCVYDNASGDETAAVVASLAAGDPRVRYQCHAENIGGAANFDFGLRQIETPFFSILSDDDYLLPDFYRRALAGLIDRPEAMFWAGLVLNVDMDGVVWDARAARWEREGLFVPPEGFLRMTGGMAPAWTGILFRREVLELEGRPDVETLGPSDLEFCLRLAARFPYLVEKHPSAVFTLNDASFSASQPMSSFWPGWKRMMKKFESDARLSFDFRKTAHTAVRRDATRMLFRRGANAIAAGRLDFARDAADGLDADCGLKGRARLLRVMAAACARSAVVQHVCTWGYRMAERRIIRSRGELQKRYGNLLRPS
ncbi:MAG: glycosyltransferase family 2 protein [Rhodanobacteraceae bacterium]